MLKKVLFAFYRFYFKQKKDFFMKRFLILSFVIAVAVYGGTPFRQGVNLTNWFQAQSAHQIQFNKFDRQDLENIKKLGFDVIRLPINLHNMTTGAPNYTIDPLLFSFLDQVVDWAEDLNLYLILDNHSFDPSVSTAPNIGDILIPVWQQMASHFKNRSDHVLYEILNEPHGIADDTWNNIQQQVVAAIRAIDSVHTIVIGPAGWNSYQNLQYMPVYSDSNLIYTFHFYEPFLFTHQGASWTSPPMVSLAGVPFPYMASRMPDCPPDLKGTWIEGALNDYQNKGTVGYVRSQLDIAIRFAQERNVPIFCGELGVYMRNSNPTDRVIWYQIVNDYLKQYDLPFTTWDYTGGFGLFEKGSNALFDYDLNVPLLKALGLKVPPQKEYVMRPDSIEFYLYSDAFGRHINAINNNWQGNLDYYDSSNPHNGQFCLYWCDAAQYASIGFDFVPDKDLSVLKDKGFVLDFWVKAQGKASSFDVRFVDTKTNDPDDHPWRMKATINASALRWDGTWQNIRIKLSDFIEGGSWDNGWFNPQGKFDWQAIDRFEIVNEYGDMSGTNLWFDDMQITTPYVIGIDQKSTDIIKTFELVDCYPNPFNGAIQIEYSIPRSANVQAALFDVTGRKIRVLQNKKLSAGLHRLKWNGRNDHGQIMPSGMYLLRLRSEGKTLTRKLLFIR